MSYRIRGKEEEFVIGPGSSWRCIDARKKAREVRKEASEGKSPQAARVAAREAETVKELAERQGEPMPPAPRDAPREPPSGGVSNERGDPKAAIRRLPPPLASPACSSFPPARFAAEELGLGPGEANRHRSFLTWVGLSKQHANSSTDARFGVNGFVRKRELLIIKLRILISTGDLVRCIRVAHR